MKKIADIIQYIESNLDSPISVEGIAAECGYSRYHFQRLFAHCVGVTVGAYIIQRRLTKAALALNATTARILEIAQAAGYDSQEAFTRAFKQHFHKTPAHYRKEKLRPVLRAFPAFGKDMVSHLSRHEELAQPCFVDKDSMAFIGFLGKIERKGPHSDVKALWKEMERRSDEIYNKRGGSGREHTLYGVLQEGATKQDGATYDTFHYTASIEVAPQTAVPNGMAYFEIAPQRYAVFEHRGGMKTLHLTNQYIWGVWLSQGNIEVAASPDLEVYPATFRPKSDERMEIWIPVERP